METGETEAEVAEALVRERPAAGHPAGCTLITPLNLGTPVPASQFSLGTEVGMGEPSEVSSKTIVPTSLSPIQATTASLHF